MKKNYYEVLGITDDEKKLNKDEFNKVLKNKFRKLSKEYHPDRNNGSKDAEEKFKEVAEAYSVLSDEKKRAEYDNPLTNHENFASGFDFNSDIDELLKSFGFNFGHRQHHYVSRGSNIIINLKVSLKDMYDGVTKKIKYHRLNTCDCCGGSGKTSDSKVEKCKYCGGTGSLFSTNGFMQTITTCHHCGGKGSVMINPCKKCGGRGIIDSVNNVEIPIPKGAVNGMRLSANGFGNAPDNMVGEYGDLFVNIVENNEDGKFIREGNDLYIDIDVPVIDAILGTTVTVDTINGKKLSAKIKGGTEDGFLLRFKGYGMPKYGTSEYGDMYGEVNVKLPKKLTNDEIKILNELKTHESFN